MMSNLEDVRSIIDSEDFSNPQVAENAIITALSISIDEDRDLALFEIVRALGAAREWTLAEMTVDKIVAAYERTDALYELSSHLASAGEALHSKKLLAEAEQWAGKISEPWQRAELLDRIAGVYLKINETEHAREVLRGAALIAQKGQLDDDQQNMVDCAGVLRGISEHLAAAGDLTSAREFANSIKIPYRRELALKNIHSIENKN